MTLRRRFISIALLVLVTGLPAAICRLACAATVGVAAAEQVPGHHPGDGTCGGPAPGAMVVDGSGTDCGAHEAIPGQTFVVPIDRQLSVLSSPPACIPLSPFSAAGVLAATAAALTSLPTGPPHPSRPPVLRI